MGPLMANKTCVVTGATNGIGAVTALKLAELGATVVGVGRNPARCAEVATRITRDTGNANVHFLVADLSSQAQVRQLAHTLADQFPRLDVLVNNAGGFFTQRQETADGIELTFGLNHLGYFLLTNLLLDVLKASAPARIVSVSSDAHRGATINFADPEYKRGYSGWTAYGQSKLANVLFTYELARRLAGAGVTANVLHPGFVATGFGHNNGALMNIGMAIVQRLGAMSPQKGAQTSIYLASAPEVEGVSGQYFESKRAVKSSPASYDADAATRLWKLSEEMTRVRERAGA